MKQKILIVDDQQDICDVLDYWLTEAEYEVTVLHEGRQAMSTVKSLQPDLVLLDIMLHDADGAMICADLRKAFPNLPVILLSAGYYQISNRPFGPSDFIEKPFDLDRVLRTIRHYLN